ncbi:hypothetical protein D9615_008019 [Tricholomella constricta]|uniref:Uncharacterized protein n=1 Tax=Tricholomella constricta TaxID=117010 RepID=A0A8H5H2E6_9AGAR|nr:hypothetical protein D9615_008019 [Tricholomella constricta]
MGARIEIHIQLPSVNENPAPSPHDAPTYPSIISIVSEDDLSRLISCTDVAEGPLSPSLFTPDPDSHSPAMDADITISIGQSPLDDTLAAPGSSKNDSMHLSPLFSHTSSPLSSPSKIVINQGRENNFLNTFEIEVQKRPPSPYNKRLRSASNNPQPTMKRAQPSVRTVSACSRRNVPLDSDLAALTLPPPPKRKTVDVWDLDAVVGQQRGRRFGKANKAKRITDGSERDRGASSSRQQYGRRRASANQKLVDKEN